MIIPAEKIVRHLIDKMFEYAELPQRYDDIKDRKDEWYSEYTWTTAQEDKFKSYAIMYLRKKLKTSFYDARTEYLWFDLMWGLRVSDRETNNTTFDELEG